MIRAGRLALLLGMVLAGPAGAAADIVDGSYGDAEGCRYAETGESSGADFFFLLNKDGVTTAASYCAFKGEGNRVGGATKVAAECHEEGYEEATPYELTLTPDGGGYTVSFPDGTRWGPLMRCKT
ncbi:MULTISPECIES: hypothetical protein [unclassified Shinella]|uniref:hypothetical protein n=1 Tax=unclassified Shinella TaxID=2643062 RepID=UPI00225D11F6|nr:MULTISPECIES: hypothetical protein [unclassified Shinella]MCO5139157.1 hypothetical protein [Shinella sp.]MDC7256113.1 hypothetical protein [Shinella sp. YE25]CAI0338953.1 conserved exported hypothetical protein [Rhizobiaceae bacterium]CAK7257379.1 conserved exported protein of unknown function [Shinella sp. WSC3-e]